MVASKINDLFVEPPRDDGPRLVVCQSEVYSPSYVGSPCFGRRTGRRDWMNCNNIIAARGRALTRNSVVKRGLVVGDMLRWIGKFHFNGQVGGMGFQALLCPGHGLLMVWLEGLSTSLLSLIVFRRTAWRSNASISAEGT